MSTITRSHLPAPMTSLEPAPGTAAGARAAESPAPSPCDLAELLDRCLGDRMFCSTILRKFADRAGHQLAALDRAVRSANAPELALQAHTLKGVAANLSAGGLRAAAAELERVAAAGDLGQVQSPLERVRAEVARCLSAMPELLARVSR